MLDKILEKLGLKQGKGILGVFDCQDKLKEAVKRIRGVKIEKLDAFTPFPVHGLEHVMGLKRSPIPWGTLVFGLTGASLAMLLQGWTSAIDWPLNVGGKPFFSWQAFIPVTFEGTILIGGVLTFLTLFHFLKLPNFFKKPLDPRLTQDHFGLFVEESDTHFKFEKMESILKECGAKEVKKIDF